MIICAECGRELASLNEPHDDKEHLLLDLAEFIWSNGLARDIDRELFDKLIDRFRLIAEGRQR